ncbi:MAG: hypothetical protein ABS81_13045 [Pseudonocardia sp. SCN 72-86]|nr:MAG: hypothetical protein ABS81_13045 [Pseudonocardia sp. SCN 72-86]
MEHEHPAGDGDDGCGVGDERGVVGARGGDESEERDEPDGRRADAEGGESRGGTVRSPTGMSTNGTTTSMTASTTSRPIRPRRRARRARCRPKGASTSAASTTRAAARDTGPNPDRRATPMNRYGTPHRTETAAESPTPALRPRAHRTTHVIDTSLHL